MTRAELIQHHSERAREATVQARAIAPLGFPEQVGAILDKLAYSHTREAAHAAGTR